MDKDKRIIHPKREQINAPKEHVPIIEQQDDFTTNLGSGQVGRSTGPGRYAKQETSQTTSPYHQKLPAILGTTNAGSSAILSYNDHDDHEPRRPIDQGVKRGHRATSENEDDMGPRKGPRRSSRTNIMELANIINNEDVADLPQGPRRSSRKNILERANTLNSEDEDVMDLPRGPRRSPLPSMQPMLPTQPKPAFRFQINDPLITAQQPPWRFFVDGEFLPNENLERNPGFQSMFLKACLPNWRLKKYNSLLRTGRGVGTGECFANLLTTKPTAMHYYDGRKDCACLKCMDLRKGVPCLRLEALDSNSVQYYAVWYPLPDVLRPGKVWTDLEYWIRAP